MIKQSFIWLIFFILSSSAICAMNISAKKQIEYEEESKKEESCELNKHITDQDTDQDNILNIRLEHDKKRIIFNQAKNIANITLLLSVTGAAVITIFAYYVLIAMPISMLAIAAKKEVEKKNYATGAFWGYLAYKSHEDYVVLTDDLDKKIGRWIYKLWREKNK